MFLRLVGSALAVFVFVVAAAYFYLVPPGNKSIRAAVPVIHEFLSAAQEGDSLRAHRLFSTDSLRNLSQDDVAILLAEREKYEGYHRLQLTTFQMLPAAEPPAPERAVVEGIVSYYSRPAARLRAQLALEEGQWRIDWLALEEPTSDTPGT